MPIFLKLFLIQKKKKKNTSKNLNKISLVIDEVKDFDGSRKCWRLIGGTLIEKTVAEVVPALKANIELLDKALV